MQQPVQFISKYTELRIVLEPRYRRIVGNHSELSGGKAVQFREGRFSTSDEEVLSALRAKGSYGIDFAEVKDAAQIEDNVDQPAPEAPEEPPVVMPKKPKQKRGARSSKDAK